MKSLSLGQVLRETMAGPAASALHLSPHQWKTIRALAACRTGALGGQIFHCRNCGSDHCVAHSCRNRHCPQCQGGLAAEWLQKQEATLLPIAYFHLVFTLPHSLNGLIRQNRAVLYKLLFDVVSETLLTFGRNRFKAQIGVSAVLHTWSQTLSEHYHLHCIVTGGGLALDGRGWNSSPDYYVFPIPALSLVFRGKFLHGLKQKFGSGELEFHGDQAPCADPVKFAGLLRQSCASNWVVYAKKPFAGPSQVLAYLSRYTHRVAISNKRLICADQRSVVFDYKDYAKGARHKTMTLDTIEFIRRFCLHILPERFVKIRHYGLLGNRKREERLEKARQFIGKVEKSETEKTKGDPKEAEYEKPGTRCPFCQSMALVFIRDVRPERAPQQVKPLDSS